MKYNIMLFRVILFLIISFYGCSTNNNTTTVVPIAPSNLTAIVISTTQVNLSWTDNATNEAGYKVQRKVSGGNFSDVGSTGADISTFNDLGLTPNTTYTYRVCAYNSAGNSLQYSNEVTVSTITAVNLPSVTIGTQIWSSKNLDVDRYRNGDPIPQVTDQTQWANLTSGAWCYYNNDPAMGAIYGKLYNWHAVNDPRGLAPQGWHVPNDAEWNKLTKFIDPNSDTTQCCSNNAGTAMKSTSGWNSCSGGNGTNSSGFSGLPGGYRRQDGMFNGETSDVFWWSSSEYDIATALDRYLFCNYNYIRDHNSTKVRGFYIRLIKD